MTVVYTVGAEPGRIDIDVFAGEPIDFTVPALDATGALEDTTGWTVVAFARLGHDTPTLYTFTLACGPGGIRVSAPAADTAGWTGWPASVPWALWVTPPASTPSPLAVGHVRVVSA